MALTGQLSDMSLAELIEFFCNQRKTGRLKVDYHRGHGVFFIKDGELVDAKVGTLSGADAVYFALTLPNAAFDFSADFEPTRRTITESWTQVVLEGLRRLDEGNSPREADAFNADWTPSEADMAVFMDKVERLGEKVSSEAAAAAEEASATKREDASVPPMSLMVESAGASTGGKRKLVMAGVMACALLACAVAAVPLARRLGATEKSSASDANAHAARVETQKQSQTDAGADVASSEASVSDGVVAPAGEEQAGDAATVVAPDEQAAALAAQRAREARERAARERERRLEEARRNEAAQKAADVPTTPAAPTVAAASSSVPKSVRVSVTYDEAGRVTQASVAGATLGAEAYGSTAVRIARGKRFPAGKSGATVVTIPIN